MNIRLFSRVLCAITAFTPFVAHSAGMETSEYLVVKAGAMNVSNIDDPLNVAIVAGMSTRDRLFAAELEISESVISADGATIDDEITLETFGVNAVARTPGDFYAKAKVGYVFSTLIHETIIATTETDSSGVTYTLGVGYEFGAGSAIEIEHMTVSETTEFLTLGFRLGF